MIVMGAGAQGVINPIESQNAALRNVLEAAHLFRLNGAVVDDLYHLPRAPDYTSLERLPFETMFFELEDPLEVQVNAEVRRYVKGILLGQSDRVSLMPWANGSAPADNFTAHFFYTGGTNKISDLPDNARFAVSQLPIFNFVSEIFAFEYDPERGVFNTQGELSANAAVYREALGPEYPDMMRKNFEKLRDLCVNVISYVNAHNVTVRRTERTDPDELARVNRRRRAKSKKELDPLKPYHWIEVREHVVTPSQREAPEGGRVMDYRERVRGHLKKVCTGPRGQNRTEYWVDSYVRGPEGAPWKENRHKVLDAMLRK
jgi:hypothetical protein